MSEPPTLSALLRLPAAWFTFRQPIRRFEYAASGFFLTAVKFALDSWLFQLATGRRWSPWNYFNPSFELRFDGLPSGSWIVGVLAALMIPFLWAGVSMTLRRCIDAGLKPMSSLLFFVPAVNYLFMLALCVLPSRPLRKDATRAEAAVDSTLSIRDAFASVAAGVAVGLSMMLGLLVVGVYGFGLFVGAPFMMGVVCAYLLNRRSARTFRSTFLVTQVALLATALIVLMFALEGVLCLAMAYPIAFALSLMGAAFGWFVSAGGNSGNRAMLAMLLALPLLLGIDAAAVAPIRSVSSSIEIDAPPEKVWRSVVAFPDLPPPEELAFRLGIAYPVRARIEGQGVGAVRYCEFSTGAFVEPITVWDEPRRLAFDVTEQPLPMQELSPYREVFAPHLIDGLTSRRGEFVLVALPGDRTRLEGRTWYTVDMFPQAYWSLWSDSLIRTIHLRVLRHIQQLSEQS